MRRKAKGFYTDDKKRVRPITGKVPYSQRHLYEAPKKTYVLTREREPWQMTKEEWKRQQGYDYYYGWAFAEYSPSQWARMSKRTQQQILRAKEEKHKRMQKILQDHENIVVHAYEEGKPVPKEVLKDYHHIIERRQARRETYKGEVKESVERYLKAKTMKKREYALWWQQKRLKETPHLKGFEHVMRQEANRYWRVVQGETKGVPRYIQEQVNIDERRSEP